MSSTVKQNQGLNLYVLVNVGGGNMHKSKLGTELVAPGSRLEGTKTGTLVVIANKQTWG
jgi:hypothetical protein